MSIQVLLGTSGRLLSKKLNKIAGCPTLTTLPQPNWHLHLVANHSPGRHVQRKKLRCFGFAKATVEDADTFARNQPIGDPFYPAARTRSAYC
jgi:hypothetical protein